MSGQTIDAPKMTVSAGEAFSSLYLRAYLSAYTDERPPTAMIAGIADQDIGVISRIAASGDKVTLELYNKTGTQCFLAAGAITAGALVYPAASGKISATAAGAPIGRALEAGSGNGSIVEVLVFDRSPDTPRKITDPGNAGAISVASSGVCSLTSGGAGHTRTLAAPTFDGQRITLTHDVDGGTCVVTVASAINETGNNTITLTDVRESITLVAVRAADALRWQVVGNDGATLSTV